MNEAQLNADATWEANRPRANKWATWIVVAIVVFMAVQTIYAEWKGKRDYQNAHVDNWKSAQGVVTSASKDWHTTRSEGYWTYKLQYTYDVDGHQYTSGRLFLPKFEYGADSGTEYRDDPKRSVGDKLTVWYNPSYPGQAILDKQLQ